MKLLDRDGMIVVEEKIKASYVIVVEFRAAFCVKSVCSVNSGVAPSLMWRMPSFWIGEFIGEVK